MSDKEDIAKARQGERIYNKFSLFPSTEIILEECKGNHGEWRTISCDGDTDVKECSDCGKQKITSCDFDKDYS